ncbi:MarR family winged helix-turn-helix transcriptional regulator [Lacibacterium aquatile]|uniref:MarR family winged helix-turn-helix transcriptional regulator n=1 Tax=Lacibacterium aquatile TaxID=1168082 RepID=A0ABW5DVX7_9PROT
METKPALASPLSSRIADGLSRVASAMRADEWSAAEAVDLTPTQLTILGYLAGRETMGARVKEIAAHLGTSQPTATDSINALERKAYVAKLASPTDKRSVSVLITGGGKAALDQAKAMGGATQDALAMLPAGEKQELLMSLVKVIRNLQEAGAIPLQRMCATCRYFQPNTYPDAGAPHHCAFVNAAFGTPDFRIDCGDHEAADPATRAATWAEFQRDTAA